MKHQFTKQELIREVKKGSKIGNLIVKTHMEFLKALAKGEIYEPLTKSVKGGKK